MKYTEYIEFKSKLRKQIQAGLSAEKELISVIYMKQRRKLLKVIRRGMRASEKLRAGVVE